MLGFSPLCQYSLCQTTPTIVLVGVTGLSMTASAGSVINVENASVQVTGVSMVVNAGNEVVYLWTNTPNPGSSTWTPVPNPSNAWTPIADPSDPTWTEIPNPA